jgi:hypothetical protein
MTGIGLYNLRSIFLDNYKLRAAVVCLIGK